MIRPFTDPMHHPPVGVGQEGRGAVGAGRRVQEQRVRDRVRLRPDRRVPAQRPGGGLDWVCPPLSRHVAKTVKSNWLCNSALDFGRAIAPRPGAGRHGLAANVQRVDNTAPTTTRHSHTGTHTRGRRGNSRGLRSRGCSARLGGRTSPGWGRPGRGGASPGSRASGAGGILGGGDEEPVGTAEEWTRHTHGQPQTTGL